MIHYHAIVRYSQKILPWLPCNPNSQSALTFCVASLSRRVAAVRDCVVLICAIPQVGQQIHDTEQQAENVLHEEEERRELLNDIGKDVDAGS